MAYRAGLTGKAAASDGHDDIILARPVGGHERLLQDHLKNRPREIRLVILIVDGNLALSGLDPHARTAFFLLPVAEYARERQASARELAATGLRQQERPRLCLSRKMSLRLSQALARPRCIFGVHGTNIELFRILRRVRMFGPAINAQIGHLLASKRPARNHALHGFHKNALRELAAEDLERTALLDAARMAGVPVVYLVLRLVAGEDDLLGVDDDDVVAVVHMVLNVGLCLPRKRFAMIVATRPTTRPWASIKTHFFSISDDFAE